MGHYCNAMIKDRRIRPRSKWSELKSWKIFPLLFGAKNPEEGQTDTLLSALIITSPPLPAWTTISGPCGRLFKVFQKYPNFIHVPSPDLYARYKFSVVDLPSVHACAFQDAWFQTRIDLIAPTSLPQWQLGSSNHLDEEGLREEHVMNLEQNMGDSSPRAWGTSAQEIEQRSHIYGIAILP